MNIFGIVGGKVLVATAHPHCSARRASDDTDMTRTGYVLEIEIGDQLVLIFQPVKSKTFLSKCVHFPANIVSC